MAAKPSNSTVVPASPHFFGDQVRRRDILTAIARRQDARTIPAGFASRPQLRGSRNSPAPNMRTAGARIATCRSAKTPITTAASGPGPAPRGLPARWPARPRAWACVSSKTLKSCGSSRQIDSRLTNRVSSRLTARLTAREETWTTVIIVGAGIGGLTLGLTLHAGRHPLPHLRIRARDQARSASASICCRMRPRNSPRSGSKQALAKAAIATTDATFFNRFGQLIYQEPLGRAAGYDHPQFSIHRGDLQMVLLDAFVRARRRRPAVTTNHHCLGVEQDDAGVTVHFSDGPGGRTQHRARPRRDRLRRHQFGDPQAVLSRRRRAALFRRQHVARRDAVEADAVGRQHGARGLAVAWQDGDLSDPRRRRRRPAARQLGRRDRDAELSQARLEPRRLARRFHRRRSPTGISTGSTCPPSSAPPIIVLEFPMVDQDPLPRWSFRPRHAARRCRPSDGAARLQRRRPGDPRCAGADVGAARTSPIRSRRWRPTRSSGWRPPRASC